MTRKILRLSLKPDQNALLERLMSEVHQTNKSAFIVYLLANEEMSRRKPRAGRPKKEDSDEEFDGELWYPSPDGGTTLYTKDEWEAYFLYRNQPVPPLPPPTRKT